MSTCPCCSGLEFEKCCKNYIDGTEYAPTAEKLMRARYAAHSLGMYDYLQTSSTPQANEEVNWDELKTWSSSVDWVGLEILGTEKGTENDTSGMVHFVAHFTHQGMPQEHREISFFSKDDAGHWLYVDGEMERQEPVRRENPKVGRNDPCTCGSGKKFKKCCG